MSTVDIEIGSRTYSVACRDGEEDHLLTLAAIVDRKAHEAAEAVGNMGEARHLLFASLLLADELAEQSRGGASADGKTPAPDPAVAEALERLAERIEKLAQSLEEQAASA